jgi:hypothetical protein
MSMKKMLYRLEKQKEILPFATTWMDPEDLMLGKISQAQDKRYMIPL